MLEKIEEILNSDKAILDKYEEVYVEFLKKDKGDNYLDLQKTIVYSDRKTLYDDDLLDDQTKNEIASIGIKYYSWLRSVVKLLTGNNDCPEQFYQKLYEGVFVSKFLNLSDREYGVILFILANQIVELPYYQAQNVLEMENEDFAREVDEIIVDVRKGLYMLKDRLGSFTAQASQLYDIADSFGDRKKAIVFWAAIISRLKKDETEEEDS